MATLIRIAVIGLEFMPFETVHENSMWLIRGNFS